MSTQHLLFRSDGNVQIVEVFLPSSVDPAQFDRLNEQLSTAATRSGQRWVMDLSETSYVGSAMLGMLVNFRHVLQSRGSLLVLCGLSPELAAVFRTSTLERLFTVCGHRDEAVRIAAAART